MLKKLYRLPAGQSIHKPSYYKSPYFIAKFSKNYIDVSRFGFVVRKALDKRAVERNRLKRLIRSCLEEELDKIQSGWDMLFVIEKGIIGKERFEIKLEVRKYLSSKKFYK